MSTAYQPPEEPPVVPAAIQGGGIGKWVIIGIMAAIGIPILLCGGMIVGLTLPAVSTAREAARRMQCTNNMKQISLALHNYEMANKTLPPAYTEDANGNRLHSWRTIILPYMESGTIYNQIDFNKPWDDPANFALLDIDMPFYSCPSVGDASSQTTYVAVVDPQGIFSGATGCIFEDIADGMSNTLLVVEVDAANSVHWASPQDIDLATLQAATNASTAHTGIFNAAMADGAIQAIGTSIDLATLKSLVTKDGGEMPVGF